MTRRPYYITSKCGGDCAEEQWSDSGDTPHFLWGCCFFFFFIVMFCGTFDCNSHFEQTRLKLFLSLLSHYVLSEKKKLCKNCVV